MNFNPLTEELLIFLEGNGSKIRGKEYITKFVIHKRSALEESLSVGTIQQYGSSIDKTRARGFIDDLEFIEQGLNGHWIDVFTFPNSQQYYLALQKRIESIIFKIQ